MVLTAACVTMFFISSIALPQVRRKSTQAVPKRIEGR